MGNTGSTVGDAYYFSEIAGIKMNVSSEWEVSTESSEKIASNHHTYHVHIERETVIENAPAPCIDILVTSLATRPYNVKEYAERCTQRMLCIRQRIIEIHPRYSVDDETVIETLRYPGSFLPESVSGTKSKSSSEKSEMEKNGYQINAMIVKNGVVLYQIATVAFIPRNSSFCYCMIYTPCLFEPKKIAQKTLNDVKEMISSFEITGDPEFPRLLPPGYEMTTFRETQWGISVQIPKQWILAHQPRAPGDFYLRVAKGFRIDNGVLGVEVNDTIQELMEFGAGHEEEDSCEEFGQTLIGAPTMNISAMPSAVAPPLEQFVLSIRDLRMPIDDSPHIHRDPSRSQSHNHYEYEDEVNPDGSPPPPSPMLSSIVSPSYVPNEDGDAAGNHFNFNATTTITGVAPQLSLQSDGVEGEGEKEKGKEEGEGEDDDDDNDSLLFHAFVPHMLGKHKLNSNEQAQAYLEWLRNYYRDVAEHRGFIVENDHDDDDHQHHSDIDKELIIRECFARKGIPVVHLMYSGVQRTYGGGKAKIDPSILTNERENNNEGSFLASFEIVPRVEGDEGDNDNHSVFDKHGFYTIPVTQVQCHRIWCVNGGRLYSFSFTAPRTVFDQFYSCIAARIIESIEFL